MSMIFWSVTELQNVVIKTRLARDLQYGTQYARQEKFNEKTFDYYNLLISNSQTLDNSLQSDDSAGVAQKRKRKKSAYSYSFFSNVPQV